MKKCNRCKHLDWDMQYAGEDFGDIDYPYCSKGYDVAFSDDESCEYFEEAKELDYEHELWIRLYGQAILLYLQMVRRI